MKGAICRFPFAVETAVTYVQLPEVGLLDVSADRAVGHRDGLDFVDLIAV